MSFEHDAFDRALRSRSDRLEPMAEQESDASFVLQLASECSPLAGALPKQILDQQAAAQLASHRMQHPRAMRTIVRVAGRPAGRIVVDWGAARAAHGVDIAVLPQLRSSGAGLHMLRAWLDVADEGGWTCTLDVNRDNPAALLYARIGFRVIDDPAGQQPGPFLRMSRTPRPQRLESPRPAASRRQKSP